MNAVSRTLLLLLLAVATNATMVDMPNIDLAGEEVVSKNSSHCNWSISMGPVCVFNDTDQVVVVPAGLTLPAGQMEVEIHFAKVLHVYPTCVSWIQVFSVELVTTLRDARDCRTWLRIYDSKVDVVSYGVKDLTLINSEVNIISLTNQRDFLAINSTIRAIESLDWIGYRGTIQNSTVSYVKDLVANDNLWILDSHFQHVASDGIVFNAGELIVTNTTIGKISSQGLCIKRGAVNITNVTVSYLDEYAINVTTSEGFLALNNFSIAQCTAPCIVATDRDRVTLKNVTIEGVLVDMSSEFLHFIYDPYTQRTDAAVQVKDDLTECTTINTTLSCDFSDVDKLIEVSAGNVEEYPVVKIRNVRFLHVKSAVCGQKLYLENIRGGSFDPEDAGVQNCQVELVLSRSEITTIDLSHVSRLDLTNSTVKRVHGGTLKALNIRSGVVFEMENITVVEEGSLWEEVEFHLILNVVFTSPVQVNNIHVRGKMHQLEFDHEDSTSSFSDIKFASLRRDSILLRRGNVTVDGIVTMFLWEGAVRLEEGTFLELKNFFTIMRVYRVISVASKDQVIMSDSTKTTWSDMLLHVRRPMPAKNESQFTISSSVSSPFCEKHSIMVQVCSFADYPKAEVNLDMSQPEVIYRTMIHSAARVNIFPCCIEKLIIQNVTSATTYDGETSCVTWLEASNVNFENITTGVNDVTLYNCTVDLLATDHKLRDIDLWSTHVRTVQGIHWEGFTGVFNSSRLDTVEGLLASSRMTMSDTHIGVLLHDGLTVKAEAVITRSTIGEVRKGGISVSGMLNIHEVNITSLDEGAIVATKGALVVFENVTISSAEKGSIVAHQGGGVAFRNVTIGGRRVIWTGTIEDGHAEANHSLIFVKNETKPEVPTKPIMPVVLPAGSQPPVDKATPSTKVPTEKVEATNPEVNSQEKVVSLEKASWKWAGAGVGFFIGLLAGGCIFFVVKVLKPNKGMLSLPTVFWRVKDDQHGLLQEDAAPDTSEHMREPGYRSVPGSDVL